MHSLQDLIGERTPSMDRRRKLIWQPTEAAALKALESVHPLSEEERALLRRLGHFRESIQAGRPFWRPGQAIGAKLILSGWAARQRTLLDGRRQIFGFVMPGDVLGVLRTPSPLEQLSTVALTRVEAVDALMLREILAVGDERHRRLRQALEQLARDEQTCLLDQVMRLGRQSALERTAHLLLELHDRARRAGLTEGDRFPMPLTQEVLADALGLSIVHLNPSATETRSAARAVQGVGAAGGQALPGGAGGLRPSR
ncbi:MAG: Crp/Fnr family transcriptional regulator [Brevundimonas sp.]